MNNFYYRLSHKLGIMFEYWSDNTGVSILITEKEENAFKHIRPIIRSTIEEILLDEEILH